jgi:hypothetical protein
MASTQVSFDFEYWEKMHDWLWANSLAGYGPEQTFSWRGEMITFEQVTKIEALRRQIEGLQSSLASQANYSAFGWQDTNNKWHPIDVGVCKVLREAYCKCTVAEIIKLLDESERLGVDVSTPKQILTKFLGEINPKEEITL